MKVVQVGRYVVEIHDGKAMLVAPAFDPRDLLHVPIESDTAAQELQAAAELIRYQVDWGKPTGQPSKDRPPSRYWLIAFDPWGGECDKVIGKFDTFDELTAKLQKRGDDDDVYILDAYKGQFVALPKKGGNDATA
jgi:hypothetical protein